MYLYIINSGLLIKPKFQINFFVLLYMRYMYNLHSYMYM